MKNVTLSIIWVISLFAFHHSEARNARLSDIKNVVVIYAENRSFDNLYGTFPGANGIENALKTGSYKQIDHDGSVMKNLPPVWKAGETNPDTTYPVNPSNEPFQLDGTAVGKPLSLPTRDLVHRFYQNQEQINGGKNDKFAAMSDAGGLTMSYYDGSTLPLWKLARQYTLADNFFMAAFGGSFLNHFWLVCACTPKYPDAPSSLIVQLDANGNLARKDNTPSTAMEGAPKLMDGSVTPDGFGVNTLQPPYQPSGAMPVATNPALANPGQNTLPPQSIKTIGDTLSEKKVTWRWYAGGWNTALVDRNQIYKGTVNFQPHHQPFNYFSRFAPETKDRIEHLKDEADMLLDIKRGRLPQVTFYKPQGSFNEHPGYTDVLSGDQHIADIVTQLQSSPQWKNMAIIISYDENGGYWDHISPPKGDRWGPGTRIPAIIISPFAKKGFIDHSVYDTTSIIKFLTLRFGLEPLSGVRSAMGDMTNAFAF